MPRRIPFSRGGRAPVILGGSSPSNLPRLTAIENMLAVGKASATLSFTPGTTHTLAVPLNKTMSGEFVALAGIASSSQGILGTVSVKEARRASASSITVVLVSTSVLSSVTVSVVVAAIGGM